MDIYFELFKNKNSLLDYMRNNIDKEIEKISKEKIEEKKKSAKANKIVTKVTNDLLKNLNKIVNKEKLEKKQHLDAFLLVNYCSYVVMLEARNSVWEYDYMSFARRIGELWEPFAKLPFQIPLKNIEIVEPSSFEQVQINLFKEIAEEVDSLEICNEKKESLINYFNTIWSFVDAGSIQLKLDLHFKNEKRVYNIDYKSGFSSNEKGNTNRLLTVGSILKMIGPESKQVIFVRQDEEENNHYLQTLKNSDVFDVYCGDETYDKIYEFTGYDIKDWIRNNIDWKNDISDEFYEYLESKKLIKYLKW